MPVFSTRSARGSPCSAPTPGNCGSQVADSPVAPPDSCSRTYAPWVTVRATQQKMAPVASRELLEGRD